MSTRRIFLKQAALVSAGSTLAWPAASYARILGANDRLRFAVVGVNGRGKALMKAVASVPNADLAYICEVDQQVMEATLKLATDTLGQSPKPIKDYRKLVELKDLDVVVIATPEHWHAPMALMAMQNGKHVYVEKPCAHNIEEARMLAQAQEKYQLQVQMGNQQRSAASSIEAMADIQAGAIGEVHYGKAWYANKRGSIGKGKPAPVPKYLDWELWQGPAPRIDYRDNVVHYNWHWFRHWGTGEIHNNGTHEIDICRWALGVDMPTQVQASGSRLFFDDDWEFADTQNISYMFPNDKMITWEGRSCTPVSTFNRGRGATIHGSKGWMLLDRNLYRQYDNNGEVVKEVKEKRKSATTNTVGAGHLDLLHMHNLANGIRESVPLQAPIADAHKSTILCHLGQIALDHGGSINTDPVTGSVIGNAAANADFSRMYEPGWEPTV